MGKRAKQKIPVFDGHNDTLVQLYSTDPDNGWKSFFREKSGCQVNLPGAGKGGLAGGFFAVCTPPPESSPERDPHHGVTISAQGYEVKPRSALDYRYARDFTGAVADLAGRLAESSDGKVKLVRTRPELTRCIENGVLALALHFEGAEAVAGDLHNLEYYYGKGLRSLGLVWSRPNVFGCGVPFQYPHSPDTGPGLTPAGRDLVAACNELGIIVDLAHITEQGFWAAAEVSKKPLVVSHAGVHALCPATRNLTDRQIDAVGGSGGVIGVFFDSANIKFQVKPDGTPEDNIPLRDIVRHIDYIANRIGIDHVALGSDFDGTDTPEELSDASGLPNLIEALRTAGYPDNELERIACRNWLRVIGDTWADG